MIGNLIYAHLSGIEERIRGMPEEKNIPTDCFNELLDQYLDSGWQRTYEYNGPDAWIDYGRVHLKSDKRLLRFRWSNDDQGSVAGPRGNISDIVRYVRDNCGERPSCPPM
ncbi:hypothetical protein [Nocardia sp. NBC_01388]|uniref:hypothetical protein n=1 Tax=Nocardia sp. NBC_01388 TaxID=2903596 RepID=UPI0032443323